MTTSKGLSSVVRYTLVGLFWVAVGLLISIVFSLVTCTGNVFLPHSSTHTREEGLSITVVGLPEYNAIWSPFNYRDVVLVYNYYNDDPFLPGNKKEWIYVEYLTVEASPEYDLSIDTLLAYNDVEEIYYSDIHSPEYSVRDVSDDICDVSSRRVTIADSRIDEISIEFYLSNLIALYEVYSIEPKVDNLANTHLDLFLKNITNNGIDISYPSLN